MTAPNTTNNVTVRKLANVAEGMWNKSKNAFVNASGDTMTGRLTMENVPINQIVTGTGTAATSSSSGGTTTYYPAKWNFDLGIATPSAGDQLVIKIPVAGHDYGTFMSTDNGMTYFPVAQSTGSTRFTTRYPVNAYVFIVFEEYTGSGNSGQVNDCYAVTGSTGRSAYKVGCWRVVNDYDSGNNYDRLYTANGRFRTGSTGCYPYSLVCLDNTQGYSTLVTSNPGTGTNKNVNTSGKFVFPASILYYAGNNTTAAGALVSSTYSTFLALPSVDVRYSSNHTTTFTTHKPVYIECTLNGDGTWSPTSNSITQTLRTGYYYIYLGIAYSTEYQVSLAPEHPLYYYDGTNLVSAEVARGDITAGTNNGEINVAGTDITVYTHPTDAGNKHIPAGGSSGQFLGWDSAGTAKWVSNPNTDIKVKATAKTDDANYKILATASASPTSGAATEAVYDTDITLNPSTNTIAANVSGTATSAGKLTTARTTYVTLGTASTSTTRDWSGTTTIPVSGTLGLGNGGTGATSAAGARTNLDVYSKSETESLLNGKVVIVTVLPATGESGVTYYVKDTSSSAVDKYDEYIWAKDAGASTESWIHVGEKSIDLSNYVNALSTSGSGPLVASLSKSGNTLTATMGTISIDDLSDWATDTDVTVSSVTYHTWWPVAPTSSNQVYGLSIYNGRLYRIYNNKGTYSAQAYDTNTTYTNKSLGQGYGTCATEAATAAKIVSMSDYALTTGGIVTVKFTNALCTSATMNINGKGAKPIYIKGAAVTANNAATVSAGDTAYFMYDGTAYHLLGTDRAATNPIVNISRSGTTFTATRLDGTTFTFTQQDNNTTYTQAKLGQGYGTCTTAEATAAKSVTLTGYELEPNGVVAVKFTNGLCASATMSINSKTATPIYINGAAVTSTSCKEVLAGDIAFFIYDGSHYQFICTDRISKNGITGLSISGRTITYTRADGSTGTLTTQDTTYTFDGVYNSSSNKAATVSTVTNAVNALDVDDITGFGAGKTLATLTETDGKIAATFQNISITKSQVSDFSHSHGNITNDGQIQSASDTAIGADDKIIVADKSNGNKLVRSSVTFDGSTTTKALTPKGTFESFVSSIKKNGSAITPSSGVADIGYMPVTEAQATATVQEVIQALRVKPGGRMGSVLLSASTVSSTSIPSAWYNYIWIPHRTGAATDDNQNFGTLIITPMTTTPDVYVIEGSNLHTSSPTYRIKRIDAVTTEADIDTGDKLLFSDASDSSKTKRMSTGFNTGVTTTMLRRDGTFARVLYADEAWGGAFRNTLSPIDVFGMMGYNVFLGAFASCIKVEYSTDGGTTWLDYGLTDTQKMTLFSQFSNGAIAYCGKNTHIQPGYTGTIAGTKDLTNDIIANQRLRITISSRPFANEGTTSRTGEFAIITRIRRLGIFMSTQSASAGTHCVVSTRTTANFEAGNDVWATHGDFAILGDSGWNSIPCDNGTSEDGFVFGGYGTGGATQYNEIRFEIWSTQLVANPASSQTGNLAIFAICGLADKINSTNSKFGAFAKYGYNCTSVDLANGYPVFGNGIKFAARKLKTNLARTEDSTFDGSANQENIPVTGTLPIANGGTGATTKQAAEYAINGNIQASTAAMSDDNRIVFSRIDSQSAENGVFIYKTGSTMWNYFKGKMSSDTGVNISGNAATASAAQTGSALETAIDSKANIANSVYYVVGSHSYASWAANTIYALNDNVVYSNRVYYCKTAHTSTSSFDSSKWTYLATVTLKGTADGITTISTGLKIAYKMPAIYGGNTSTYLNINNLGSYYIKRNNGNMSTHIPPNAAAFFVFDGTAWQWADYDSNTNNWVTTMGAYCDTAAATAAKVATSTNTVLTAGMSFLIRIVNSNTSAGKLTLNINSTGAKDVWINGAVSSSSNYTLPAGEHWCHYDGSVFHIWTDGTVQFKQLKLTNKLSDDNIASAATWNAKQDALSTQTAYSAKGTATKVPQITTNSLGQVTGITEVTISGVTPASHTHGNIANGGTLTDTAAAAAGNDYVVIRDADNAKIQTSTIKGTDVADAVSKKHSHSTLTLSTTAQAYDGSHTLALPSTDPYTSARTPASHTHGNIANGGTLTDTAAAAAGNDYVVIRDADNAKIQTSTIKGTDVADAVSKKHSHSTLTLSKTAQVYDGTHTLVLPADDPYTSARTPTEHQHEKLSYTNLADAVLPNNDESGVLRRFYSTGVPTYCSFIKMFDVTQFYDGTIVNNGNEQSTFIGDVSFIRCSGGTLVQKVKVVMGLAYASSWARLYGDSKFCHPVVIKDSINRLSSWIVNNYIPIGDVGSTVSLTPTANNNLAYCVIDCSNYSTMYVNLYSVTGAPAWAFIDASNTILSRCSGIGANATLDVPQGAVKLICNIKNTTEYKNNCYAAVDADAPRYYLALRTEGVTMSCNMVCEGRFYTRTTATATIAARPLLTNNIMVPNYGASSTSLPVGYTVQQDTSFTDVAGTIGTARELAVSLSNTSTTTKFDGSANVTNIKVSGTLPISNGGTGATTKKAAEYAINGGMSEATAAMQDNFQIVFSQVGSAQNATNGVFLYRQASTVWNYFKTKFSYMTQAEEDNLITELGDL